ncbi:MAG: hypothetical protein WBG73_19280 [Coleofasciculaceae cyanobacterium]
MIMPILVRLISLLLFLSVLFAPVLPAQASFCRNSEHLICIISIKRSAKNYWEYRAAVSVDQVVRPIELYNCRDRFRVRQDGKVIPFQTNGAGKLICSFFQK